LCQRNSLVQAQARYQSTRLFHLRIALVRRAK
jgi:hypothetical protein